MHETGAKQIGISKYAEDKFGLLMDFYDIEQLEVVRETKPDFRSVEPYWDTWRGDGKDLKMPKEYHFFGEPMSWTGETWFQLARPKTFKDPVSGKICTWALGEKCELRKNSQRPEDIATGFWNLMSYDDRKKYHKEWITKKKPMIDIRNVS